MPLPLCKNPLRGCSRTSYPVVLLRISSRTRIDRVTYRSKTRCPTARRKIFRCLMRRFPLSFNETAHRSCLPMYLMVPLEIQALPFRKRLVMILASSAKLPWSLLARLMDTEWATRNSSQPSTFWGQSYGLGKLSRRRCTVLLEERKRAKCLSMNFWSLAPNLNSPTNCAKSIETPYKH